MIWSPTLRPCFGPGFAVPGLPFEVPGALALPASGFLLLGVGGMVLDNLWHTSFGLDETAWSFPHALMAWALLLTLLGCIAAHLALLRRQTWRWPTAVVWVFLILSFSVSPFLGPLNKNATPGIVQAIAAIPTLRDRSTAAHTARIYLDWSLDRTNPLIMLLAASWAGVVLRIFQRLDRRASVMLSAIGIWSVLVAWAGTCHRTVASDLRAHKRDPRRLAAAPAAARSGCLDRDAAAGLACPLGLDQHRGGL